MRRSVGAVCLLVASSAIEARDLPTSRFPFEPPPGADDRSAFTAVRDQLGLELEPSFTDLDVLAIARVARPMTD